MNDRLNLSMSQAENDGSNSDITTPNDENKIEFSNIRSVLAENDREFNQLSVSKDENELSNKAASPEETLKMESSELPP